MPRINTAMDRWSFGCVLWEIKASETIPVVHMIQGADEDAVKYIIKALGREKHSATSVWGVGYHG